MNVKWTEKPKHDLYWLIVNSKRGPLGAHKVFYGGCVLRNTNSEQNYLAGIYEDLWRL